MVLENPDSIDWKKKDKNTKTDINSKEMFKRNSINRASPKAILRPVYNTPRKANRISGMERTRKETHRSSNHYFLNWYEFRIMPQLLHMFRGQSY